MGTTLDERLVEILVAIVDAYDAQDPNERQRLYHYRMLGGEGMDDIPDLAVTRDDLDELRDVDLIDIDYTGTNLDYAVKPTSEGRQAVRRLRREQKRQERAEPVDLSWTAVRPVLHAVVDIWTESGASSSGYLSLERVAERLDREPDDLGLIRAAELLATEDWFDLAYPDEEEHPILRPTSRGVMATRGWPGGDAEVAAERLLSVLDDIAENSPDEEKRTWAVRLRSTAGEVTTKVLADVISKTVGGAL